MWLAGLAWILLHLRTLKRDPNLFNQWFLLSVTQFQPLQKILAIPTLKKKKGRWDITFELRRPLKLHVPCLCAVPSIDWLDLNECYHMSIIMWYFLSLRYCCILWGWVCCIYTLLHKCILPNYWQSCVMLTKMHCIVTVTEQVLV